MTTMSKWRRVSSITQLLQCYYRIVTSCKCGNIGCIVIENDLNTIESDRVSNLCHQDQDYAEPRPAFRSSIDSPLQDGHHLSFPLSFTIRTACRSRDNISASEEVFHMKIAEKVSPANQRLQSLMRKCPNRCDRKLFWLSRSTLSLPKKCSSCGVCPVCFGRHPANRYLHFECHYRSQSTRSNFESDV